MKFFVVITVCCFFSLQSFAQLGQKPSANYTKEKTDVKTNISSFNEINSDNDFNKLSRVYNKGTINEIPHILFLIDRQAGNKVYYLNTPKFEFHIEFINELLNKSYTALDIKNNYIDADRRFILGTISWQNTVKTYVFEFWEGDKITNTLLQTAQKAINQSFLMPIIFKTNSTENENTAKQAGIKYVSQDEIVKQYTYIAINCGKSKGRIRVAESIDDIININDDDILVLSEVPISIPLVAGVITDRASTLLSHVNVLARSMKIPSIYLKDASAKFKFFDGKYVEFKADENSYDIKVIPVPKSVRKRRNAFSVKSDITFKNIASLSNIREDDYVYYGVKAANLGEIKAKIKDVKIPDGFSLPFNFYHSFVKQHNFDQQIKKMQNSAKFNESADVRRAQLTAFRERMENAEINKETLDLIVKTWQTQLNSKGVFVRSSSNAEDLKNFSGAGLFTTVPNVKTATELASAVKKVWASVYNFEAYEARRIMGVPDSLILMSVLIQHAADSDISGVMITKDPFNSARWDMTYIAAKRGIGIKVVEGKRIAEQVVYSFYSKAVQLISKSEENTELRLDPKGGIKEVPTSAGRVMSDDLVVKLATQGNKIKKLFKTDMDIEWAVSKGQIIILQARPYK